MSLMTDVSDFDVSSIATVRGSISPESMRNRRIGSGSSAFRSDSEGRSKDIQRTSRAKRRSACDSVDDLKRRHQEEQDVLHEEIRRLKEELATLKSTISSPKLPSITSSPPPSPLLLSSEDKCSEGAESPKRERRKTKTKTREKEKEKEKE
eukprot:CAMPEP_0201528354 /NCGR_PEP_ID=MMETSP0161_2-20130828/38087_1 /ASSEMBLY_ACC=CAM_ASM_000251 /TAXON_ID=180227 /ORGANISM="Neoparamoeba aestuarina, Strain SoJaBio B1-5/56/2" /LENGTH=150 /DNA_ID=CAMNT_0047929605 /DNA_START=28 /DNA_END=477 /DNA_ORIENTATION=+